MLEEELRSAALKGQLDLVQSLIKQGAKSAPDSSGRTPLHLSSAAGHVDVVKALVTHKNVNSVDSLGRTALQLAASGGHVQIVNLLLKAGANVNARDTLHGNTALHEASWHGFSQTVSMLCKANSALDLTNSAGFAAIHLCCQNGHNQSCRELLISGANPNVQNNYGDTSLHTSARYGHAGVARILLSANCKVSEQNKNGDTALHIAAAMGRRKLTSIFLEAGCDSSIRNKQFETALDIALRKELDEIIAIMNNVKPNKKKNKKSSETSDSDKKSKETNKKTTRSKDDGGIITRWSPYGCHYYPDLSLFPQPRLDSLPDEPLSKGEQYYLDLAGNIRKGPIGVGLTCHCSNFVLDMESRLEHHSVEMRQRLRAARARLEHRVTKTEGMLRQFLGTRRPRSRSLDLLHSNHFITNKLQAASLKDENEDIKVEKTCHPTAESEDTKSSKGQNQNEFQTFSVQI